MKNTDQTKLSQTISAHVEAEVLGALALDDVIQLQPGRKWRIFTENWRKRLERADVRAREFKANTDCSRRGRFTVVQVTQTQNSNSSRHTRKQESRTARVSGIDWTVATPGVDDQTSQASMQYKL